MEHHKREDVTILLIDDEEIIREAFACYLEDMGYTVLQAENGKIGIELFQNTGPDLVLTDLRMPVCDGKEVLGFVLQQSEDVPVIIVSGAADVNEAIETVRSGAWDYITKPIRDAAVLDHAIQNSLERLKLTQENKLYRENLESALRATSIDLKMAVNVQKNFFPQKPPHVPGWDISFIFKPMAGVSGDFYDFYTRSNRLDGVSIFDVSGHGVASGLVTMLAKSIIFRTFSTKKDHPLNEVMDEINRELIEEIDKVDNYLTGIILHIRDDILEYVNAAHPPMLYRRTGSREVLQAGEAEGYDTGALLGIHTVNIPYEMITLSLEPQDMYLLYTDCILEAMDKEGRPYGLERLRASFSRVSEDISADTTLLHIFDDFSHFVDSPSLPDDLTIILLKKTE